MSTWTTLLRMTRSQLGDPGGTTWSDTDMIDWFVEAQEQACRKGYLLRASKSVTISAGTAAYAYPDGAIDILRMSWGGNERPMTHKTVGEMDRIRPGWDQGTKEGTPTHWVTGKATKQFSVFLTPTSTEVTASDTLSLTCVVLPSTTPTIDEFRDNSTEPEIEPEHHFELIDYVKFRAHNRDTELDGDKKAAADLAIFEANMRQAKNETLRRRGAVSTAFPGHRGNL